MALVCLSSSSPARTANHQRNTVQQAARAESAGGSADHGLVSNAMCNSQHIKVGTC